MSAGAPCRVRVIAVGNPFAGDDGVGIEVIRRLRAGGLDPDVEAVEARDGVAVAEALQGTRKAIVVDAAVTRASAGAGRHGRVNGGRRETGRGPTNRGGAGICEAGRVLRLGPEELCRSGITPISTHGLGVADAIRLARAVSPRTAADRVVIVAVVVEPMRSFSLGLSSRVSAAVEQAVWLVREEIRRTDE